MSEPTTTINVGKKTFSVGRVLRAVAALGVVLSLALGYISPESLNELIVWLVFAVLMFDHRLLIELAGEAAQLIKAWRSK